MVSPYDYFQKGANRQLDQIWLVMELCDGGSVAELVQGLKKACIVGYLKEIEIAYILRWFSVGICKYRGSRHFVISQIVIPNIL